MLWDVYINVYVTNLISANDVSHRTYWKAKIIGAKIYKLCGRWRRKEKGQLPVTVVETLHGGRWRSSNPVGQKQSHDRDQDYEFADIASSSIWVCFKQNCDDFRSECPWRSFVVLIAEQFLWMTDSHVFKLVKFVYCKNNPTRPHFDILLYSTTIHWLEQRIFKCHIIIGPSYYNYTGSFLY